MKWNWLKLSCVVLALSSLAKAQEVKELPSCLAPFNADFAKPETIEYVVLWKLDFLDCPSAELGKLLEFAGKKVQALNLKFVENSNVNAKDAGKDPAKDLKDAQARGMFLAEAHYYRQALTMMHLANERNRSTMQHQEFLQFRDGGQVFPPKIRKNLNLVGLPSEKLRR